MSIPSNLSVPVTSLDNKTTSTVAPIDFASNRVLIIQIVLFVLFCHSLGYFGFSIVWLFAATGLAVFGVVRTRKALELHNTIRFQQLMHHPSMLQHSLPVLPSWISFPDWEKADFIQSALATLWPYVKKAAEDIIMTQMAPMLNSMKPPFLTGLTIGRLDLGNIPASVHGVKVHAIPSAGALYVDMSVEFAGNPVIAVEARSGPIVVSVYVADFVFKSSIRVLLKPLSDEIPCISAVSLSLTRKPDINFKLDTGAPGLNVMSIPGLNDFLYTLIKDQVAAQLVWPKKIVVPLKPLEPEVLAGLQSSENQGVLEVRVYGAKDIKVNDVYAKLTLGDKSFKTKSVKPNGDVLEWGDTFEFLVSDPRTEQLTVSIKNKENMVMGTLNTLVINRITQASSKLLGDCEVPLDSLRADEPTSMWIPLSHSHRGKGTIHLSLHYKPFKTNKTDEADSTSAPRTPPPSRLTHRGSSLNVRSCKGLLTTTIHKANGLRNPNGSNQIDPFVQISVGNARAKTRVIQANDAPEFETQFELQVSDSANQELLVEVADFNRVTKNQPLGELTIPIYRIQRDGKKQATYPLTKCQGGTITLTTEFREY